jgi:hypothetical protein
MTSSRTSSCCDGTGMADYAAVPCPNPDCPVEPGNAVRTGRTFKVGMSIDITERDGRAVIATGGLGEIGSCDRKAFLGAIAQEFRVVITAASDTVDPTDKILDEVYAERGAQDTKWGEQNHPDGTGAHLRELAAVVKQRTQKAAERGKLTWRDILDEEVTEAWAESNPVKLRAELVQVAAVASAWIEAIDRRLAE